MNFRSNILKKVTNNKQGGGFHYELGIRRLLTTNLGGSEWGPQLSSQTLINVNFLVKERLYTKLKYSRSPAYDTVSGGAAALFAGFVGFLISEKYGFELVDSGDFYYLFMYIVFLSFSLKPLLTLANANRGFFRVFTLKEFFIFYRNIFILIINYFRGIK